MNRSVYDILGLPRDLPGWKLTSKVHQVTEELAEAYHGAENVPGLLRVAVDILSDADKRDRYDSLLEWAEEGTEVDFGDQTERVRQSAEQLHFKLEDQPGGSVLIRNLGVPEPPSPPPPPKAAPSPGQRPTLRAVPVHGNGPVPQEPRTPEQSDEEQQRQELSRRYERYGIVNGQFPPLPLGNRVYSISFSPPYRLSSAVRIQDGIHFNWSRQRDDGSLSEFAFVNWLGPAYTVEWAIGRPHRFMQLTDTRSRDCFDVAFYAGEYGSPILSTHTIWAQFPWWAQFQSGSSLKSVLPAQSRYSDAYPHRPVAPDYMFTATSGWDRETSAVFMTFIEEVCYWTRAHRVDFSADPAEIRQFARNDVHHVCRVFTETPKRFRKKVGLPYK